MKLSKHFFTITMLLAVIFTGSSVIIFGCSPEEECAVNNDCFPDQYCLKGAGECNGTGECEIKPDGCPEILAPVCGCDGNTYENDCFAAEAGVNVDYDGECGPGPASCTSDDDCTADPTSHSYCAKEPGACDSEGTCQARPEMCTTEWNPVCGCDGNTYSNACVAAGNGINVDYAGECGSNYCWDNKMCGTGNYCYFADCALETGRCRPRPEICTYHLDPVCGCDGIIYPNDCSAAANGISVDYRGECRPVACCFDACGNGSCDQLMCIACGCPCYETPETCPQDCPKDGQVCCESFGYGSEMKKCCETYSWTLPADCTVPGDWVGGSKQIVADSYCTGG